MKIELRKTSSKQRRNQSDPVYSTQRGLVVGGAIGLYMGIFFRPSREPDLGFVLGLIIFATLATFAVRYFRGSIPRAAIPRELLRSFAFYFFALLALEGRHYVLNAAGQIVLAIFTTGLGALSGYLWVNFGGSVRNIGEVQRDDQER
jgi:multisubunit Na+/H+ antiporter MnhB subunit